MSLSWAFFTSNSGTFLTFLASPVLLLLKLQPEYLCFLNPQRPLNPGPKSTSPSQNFSLSMAIKYQEGKSPLGSFWPNPWTSPHFHLHPQSLYSPEIQGRRGLRRNPGRKSFRLSQLLDFFILLQGEQNITRSYCVNIERAANFQLSPKTF